MQCNQGRFACHQLEQMIAKALGCDKTAVGLSIVSRKQSRVALIVNASCWRLQGRQQSEAPLLEAFKVL